MTRTFLFWKLKPFQPMKHLDFSLTLSLGTYTKFDELKFCLPSAVKINFNISIST